MRPGVQKIEFINIIWIMIIYLILKLCLTHPVIPKLPLYFEKVDLISDALLFLLSVRDSTRIATPLGPNPHK